MKAFKVTLFLKESEKENKLIQEYKMEQGKNPEKTNITISEGTISRTHAVLSCTTEGNLFIKDLNSANGTFVDGEQIEAQKQIKLDLNSKVNLGESKFFLIISVYEPDQNVKNSQSKVRDNDRKIRDKSRESSVSSSSSDEREKRRKSKDRDYRSRKYKRSQEKEGDRYKDKKEDRYRRSQHKSNSRSHPKRKKSNSRSRRKSRSLSKSDSRKFYNPKYDKKENISKDTEKPKVSKEIENIKEHAEKNYADDKIYDKKESIRKSSFHQDKKNQFIDEKLLEDMERKKKYFEEFLKLKELESGDIKLKLPKLIDKEKVNPQVEKNEIASKPNLTEAFKKLEENNQLKGISNNNLGYAKHGNNNINIHRKKSYDNDNRIENKYEQISKNYTNGSSLKKPFY